MLKEMRGADNRTKDLSTFGNYYLKPTRQLLQKVSDKYFPGNKNTPDQHIKSTETSVADSIAAVVLLESWLATKRLTEFYGGRFVCILQPTGYVGKPRINYLPEVENLSYSYYTKVLELLNTDKYSALNENFVDLTSAFDNIDNLYIDFCHVGPEGNKVIAVLILKYLNRN